MEQEPPNAADAQQAISNQPPSPFPQGVYKLHKGRGCTLRTGRCPLRGWQQGHDQPTVHGTIDVVQRYEILGGGGRWDRRGCAQGAPKSANRQGEEQHGHRMREPHQEGRRQVQQTRKRGVARQGGRP